MGEEIKIGKAGNIRNSQLVTTYGCGAICDFPGISGIVSGIDDWIFDRYNLPNFKIREPYLENILNTDYFLQIIPKDDKDDKTGHIPIYRFPEWYYCPECGQLGRYSDISYTAEKKTLYCNSPDCKEKKVKLNPSRFIVACANGHLQDFPYDWWVHRHKKCTKSINERKLKMTFDPANQGLDGIIISCNCGAKENMEGALNPDLFKNYNIPCRKEMPWLHYKGKTVKDNMECNAIPKTLLRSGNNVYYSLTMSAISLPNAESVEKAKDWINDRKEKIAKYLSTDGTSIESYCDGVEEKAKNDPFSDGKGLPCEKNIIIRTYNRFMNNTDFNTDAQRRQLIKDEYYALCENEANDEDKYFRTASSTVPEKYNKLISKIRLVKKMREVVVLKGFNRILPEYTNEPDTFEKFGERTRDYMIVNNPYIKKEYDKWLPAVQLIGEGIFIELNKEKIREWSQSTAIKNRYAVMKKRVFSDLNSNLLKEIFSEEYVLLHTLSHLLIRQLSHDCGYNSASIKEKIYSCFNIQSSENGKYEKDTEGMCGILIYTASPDSDGSLGGLVRQGNTKNIERLLDNMLENAYWCSNDPVCNESTNQGYRSLNFAACHACTLLPETSCESFNSLLDRAAIIGVPGDDALEEIGYFNSVINEVKIR